MKKGYDELYRDIFSDVPDIKVPDNTNDAVQTVLKGTRILQIRLLSLVYGLDGEEKHTLHDAAKIVRISEGRAKELMTRTFEKLRKKSSVDFFLRNAYNDGYSADDLGHLPVEAMNLPNRSYHTLKRAGIGTVLDALNATDEEITGTEQAGKRTLEEIRKAGSEFLQKNGIRWEDVKK